MVLEFDIIKEILIMCKLSFKNTVSFVAVRSPKFRDKLDYYFILPGRGYEYAFTKDYTTSCFRAYKNPVLLNKVMHSRSGNVALMNTKKYLHYMLPYLVDYLDLESFVVSKRKKESRRSFAA